MENYILIRPFQYQLVQFLDQLVGTAHWQCGNDSHMLVFVSHFFELTSHCLVHPNRQHARDLFNMNDWWSNIKISSCFSFWKADYFSNMTCLENIFDRTKILDGKTYVWYDFMFFLNKVNHIKLFFVILKSGYISLKTYPISMGEILTKTFRFYHLRKSVYLNLSGQVALAYIQLNQLQCLSVRIQF